jgi:hypothetical protein
MLQTPSIQQSAHLAQAAQVAQTAQITVEAQIKQTAQSTRAAQIAQAAQVVQTAQNIRYGRLKMLLILAVCASPVLLGTLAYFFYKPESTTNYGSFVLPQRPAAGLEAFRGKWVMLTVDSALCDEHCAKRLYLIRQLRLTQGKEKDRIERVLILSNPGPARFAAEQVDALEKVHEGLHQILMDQTQRRELLGQDDKAIYLVDPLGNLMMRFPEDPDPSRMKKDLSKLLKWSRVG